MIIAVRAAVATALTGCLTAGALLTGCAAPAPGPEPAGTGRAQEPAGPDGTVGPQAPPRSAAPPADAAPPAAATLPLDGGRMPVFRHGPREGLENGGGEGGADKAVALTFDADMTADQTGRAAAGEPFDNPALVDLLRRENIPATVFMTGMWARTYPGQAASIGRDPLFEVANHSYAHHAFADGPCWGLPALDPGEFAADVRRAEREIRAAGVERTVPYFRFPGGCHDDEALRALAPLGLTAVQWDVAGGDAFATDPDAVAGTVLSQVAPGSVVVLHITRSAAPVTTEAVRRMVPVLRERGYRFVKVSELIRQAAGPAGGTSRDRPQEAPGEPESSGRAAPPDRAANGRRSLPLLGLPLFGLPSQPPPIRLLGHGPDAGGQLGPVEVGVVGAQRPVQRGHHQERQHEERQPQNGDHLRDGVEAALSGGRDEGAGHHALGDRPEHPLPGRRGVHPVPRAQVVDHQ